MKKSVLREIIPGCLCSSLSSVHGQTNVDTRQHKNSSNFQMATFSYVCQLSLIFDSDPEKKKLFRKLLKDSETVRNKDRMAVDPILDLTADVVISAVQNVGSVVHTPVAERFKFTEDNKVGAYPHPVAVTNAGGGILFMLDFAPLNNQSKVVKLQLHDPVRVEVVKEKLPNVASHCVPQTGLCLFALQTVSL